MRPVILSSPEKAPTGLEMVSASAGAAPSAASVVTMAAIRPVMRGGLFRRPGVVVARDARPLTLVEQAAIGAIGQCRAGKVGLMRLLPVARSVVLLARRHIGAVVHPAMPAGRDGGSLGIAAGIDHHAALTAVRTDR